MQTFMEETKEKVKQNQSCVQRKQSPIVEKTNANTTVQRNSSSKGLPEQLKFGIEKLSGLAMDDVVVHYNSSKPAQMKALAYTQGTDIHVAPGQERHLGHEAWHVVQQKQGRVKPTTQMKGRNVNDDSVLEKEADVMGMKAVQMNIPTNFSCIQRSIFKKPSIQRKVSQDLPIQYYRVYHIETNLLNPIVKKSAIRAEIKGVERILTNKNLFVGADKNLVEQAKLLAQNAENERENIKQTKMDIANKLYDKVDAGVLLEDTVKKIIMSLFFDSGQTVLAIMHKIGIMQKFNSMEVGEIRQKFQIISEAKRQEAIFLEQAEQVIKQITNEPISFSDLNNENYDQAMLGTNENVLIVSHGEKPNKGLFYFLQNPTVFGNMYPQELAAKIVKIIPDKYTGEIYLNGCYTGMPRNKLYDGTSFAEQFGTELIRLLNLSDSKKKVGFKIKGNLGATTILSDVQSGNLGKANITLDNEVKALIQEKEKLMIDSEKVVFSTEKEKNYERSQEIYFHNKKVPSTVSTDIGNPNIKALTGSATKMIYYFSN